MTTTYTVSLDCAIKWESTLLLHTDLRNWCRENDIRFRIGEIINTRFVIIKNPLDGVAFKLKFGQYIIKEESRDKLCI